jgi:hypothetical protein
MKYLISLTVVFLLCSCADYIPLEQASDIPKVGFWYGLWHGIIFPVAWVVSLFDEATAIYAIYNNGGWYDFGFFIGVGGFSASMFASGKKK